MAATSEWKKSDCAEPEAEHGNFLPVLLHVNDFVVHQAFALQLQKLQQSWDDAEGRVQQLRGSSVNHSWSLRFDYGCQAKCQHDICLYTYITYYAISLKSSGSFYGIMLATSGILTLRNIHVYSITRFVLNNLVWFHT